jgi:hypothetical protein
MDPEQENKQPAEGAPAAPEAPEAPAAPETPEGDMPEAAHEDTPQSKNMVIVAVLAVIVVVLALMYIWGSQMATEPEIEVPELPPVPVLDEQTEALKDVSSSDEVEAIAEDLETTDLEDLDAGLAEMEAELDQAMMELEEI